MQANSPKFSSKSSIKFSNLHFDLSLEQKIQKEIPHFSFWYEAAQLAPLTSYAQKLVMKRSGGALGLFYPVLEQHSLDDLRELV